MKKLITIGLLTAGFALAESPFATSGSADLRFRGESWENFGFVDGNEDSFFLSRLRLRGELEHDNGIRLGVELKSSLINQRDLPGGERPLDKDPIEIQQAWIDVPLAQNDGKRNSIVLGRQELSYGAQRLISPLAWSNTGRSWDGARLVLHPENWNVDAFYTYFVPVDTEDLNEVDEDNTLMGIYASHNPDSCPVNYEVYALRHETLAADRNTFGLRFNGSHNAVSFDVEGAHQSGETGDLDIDAWMLASKLSYTVPGCPLNSTWSLGYDVSSGDDDATDGDSGTFHPLFPLGHKYHGFIDAIGRRNVTDFSQSVVMKPCNGVKIRVAHHFFDRTETSDGVYHAGNGVLITGDASDAEEIGSEIDITINWAVDSMITLEAGYSQLFAGDVVDDNSADAEDIQFAYFSSSFTF